MKRLAVIGVAFALAGCAVLEPAIVLSRSEIGQRAFIDRREVDLKKVFKGMEGLSITGPDVGFQTAAQRLELAWTARPKESPLGIPLSLRVSLSGAQVLNAQKNGIDLADVRIEEVRLPSIPFVNLDTKPMGQSGESLGTLPLLQFQPEELNRDGVVYQATGISLGTFGLRVDLAPK